MSNTYFDYKPGFLKFNFETLTYLNIRLRKLSFFTLLSYHSIMVTKKMCMILSMVLLLTSTALFPGQINAQDIWQQFGIFGEMDATVVYGSPGLSVSPDVCFEDGTGFPRLVWADTLTPWGTVGTFNIAFSWFNGYSFRGNKYGSRTMGYLNQDMRICTSPKIENIGNGKMLAVWATTWATNSNVYWTVYDPLSGSWSVPDVVNSYPGDIYEYTPDIKKGTNGNVWLTYVKTDNEGKKNIVVSRFTGTGWDRLPGDVSVDFLWGTIIENEFDSIAPKVIEAQDGNPAVFYEGVVSSSNSDIFCTKWNNTLGKWFYYNNSVEGVQNISNSPKPSHTPSVAQDSLGRPHLVWSEAYPAGQESGISYCRWNGNLVNILNQPGYTIITSQNSNGNATKPSIIVDTNDQPMVAFDIFDKDTSKEMACVTFFTANGFVDPFNGMRGFGWVKDDYYNEFTDCQLERNPNDPDSPVLIGICKTPKKGMLQSRNPRDTNIFYVVLKKNPQSSFKNPLSILCRPFDRYINYNYSKWFSLKPDENTYDFLININEKLNPNERLYITFNQNYYFNGNPWGNINKYSSEFLSPIKWSRLKCEWWNPLKPGTNKWDDSYPWSATFNRSLWAIRINELLESESISVIVDYDPNIVPYFDHPRFYTCEAFVSSQDYTPSLPPYTFFNPYDPPFSTSNINRLNAWTGMTPIESKDYFVLEPQYYEVDQGSMTTGSFMIINPLVSTSGTGQTVYGRFSYRLVEVTGSAGQGVYVGFYPNNEEVVNEPYAVGGVYISASLEANPVIYNLQVLCQLTIYNQYTISYMSEITVRVKAYELSVKKTADKSRVDLGETIMYTINVRNTGDGAATNVQVFDNLPRELEFISASDDGALDGAKVTWVIKKIFGGQAYNLRLFVRVREDTNLKNGDLIINSAYLKSGKGSKENSVGILIQTYLPGCPKPQVEFKIDGAGKNPTFEAGQELNAVLNVSEGCGPFDASVNWGDGSKSQRFVVGSSGQAKTSFTYELAGDYTIFIQVNDIYGKCTNVYKNIRIK